MNTKKKEILHVEGLSISFRQYTHGWQQRTITPIKALNINVRAGEVHAVIGASGSGKSLLAHAILGILPANSQCNGYIFYKGQLLTEQRKETLRGRKIAFVPQSVNYLDPLMKVGRQISLGLNGNKNLQANNLLKAYGLTKIDGQKYPYELSGGMLRRVLFATSVREGIEFIIADEPTPGIHQEALQAVLKELRLLADNGAAVMMITHDIKSALTIGDRVTVMREGTAIETSSVSAFSGEGNKLQHPYTKMLWLSIPENQFINCQEDQPWL